MAKVQVRDPVSGFVFQVEQYEPPATPFRLNLIPCPRPRRLSEPALWSHLLQIPNRLFGATITPEGDAT